MIGFNKPYLTGDELKYIEQAVQTEKISGNGVFTGRCHKFFLARYGFNKTLLTHSCTGALEMAAMLSELGPGDEVIVPSFTFVSSATAFVLRGAKVVFVDSESRCPNIDPQKIAEAISPRTKAIVVVHYAGIACDMDPILELARAHGLIVIEDAAHAIEAKYKDRWLGGIGDLATFSFHETKNIICGEGGLLVVNCEKYHQRADILWEKGTNRVAFSRREVSKYEWVDIGSSFLPSEITAAFLLSQLEHLESIQARRVAIWSQYYEELTSLAGNGVLQLPFVPQYSHVNGHIFYVMCESFEVREKLRQFLVGNGIQAVFHYLPLHLSPFYRANHDGRLLPNAERFSDCLLRMPLFYELTESQVSFITSKVQEFYQLGGS